MQKQQTITINGVSYDARTGLRVIDNAKLSQSPPTSKANQQPAAARAASSATAASLHSRIHRSTTLNRQHVKAPAKNPYKVTVSNAPKTLKSAQPIKRTYAKHPKVYRFKKPAELAPSHVSVQKPQPKKPASADIKPMTHPVHQAVVAKQATRKQPVATHLAVEPTPSKIQKQQIIEQALKNAKPTKKEKLSLFKRANRLMSIASASLAIVLLAGYFTYINLPSLSVRVAAAQAGIEATYPGYQPSGYSLSGPIAHSSGEVSMKFASNTGPRSFDIVQQSSNWNSSALLENYVAPESNGDYQTMSDGGLTIYTYGRKAVWVNGGILHTVQGDAELSSDQLQKIAESM